MYYSIVSRPVVDVASYGASRRTIMTSAFSGAGCLVSSGFEMHGVISMKFHKISLRVGSRGSEVVSQ